MDISQMPRISPSKQEPSYWTGTRFPGDRYTREQEARLKLVADKAAQAQKRYGLPESYQVKKFTETKRNFDIPDVLMLDCPVLSCTKDRTRLKVIAPNGMETWVDWKQK